MKWLLKVLKIGKIVYKYLPEIVEEIRDDWELGKEIVKDIRENL